MSTSSRFVAKNGLDNNGQSVVNIADPVNAQDLATKNYSSNGTNLTSGVIAPARLGSGTGSASNFLRGDGTWGDPLQLTKTYPTVSPTLNLDFINNTQLDPRITFTRSTTGTYYDGKTTTKADENLLIYSQDFSNAAWSIPTNTVKTLAQTAPDGTNTAALIAGDGVSNRHFISHQMLQLGTFTFSSFVKANTNNYVQFIVGGANTTQYANFDVGTGVVGTKGSSAISSSITSVGNGWYRCAVTMVCDAASTGILISLIPNASDGYYISNTLSTSVYIWGAQIEQRSAMTAYTPTVANPITNYMPVLVTAPINSPRFDHSPTTKGCLGLLIEESRTNLLTYSEDFSNSVWNSSGIGSGSITVSNDGTISPMGTSTSSKVLVPTIATSSALNRSFIAAATTYTLSFWVKAGNKNSLAFGFYNKGWNVTCVPTIVSGPGVLTGNTLVYIDGLSTTQWTKVSLATSAALTASTSYGVLFYPGHALSELGQYVYLWGAQVEQGGNATSYIPTTTTTVTRAADDATMTNVSSWYNLTEGTIFCNADCSKFSAYPTLYSMGIRTFAMGNGVLQTGYLNTYDAQSNVVCTTNTTISSAVAGTYVAPQNSGTPLVASLNLVVNGGAMTQTPTYTWPNYYPTLELGRNSASWTGYLNGHIKSFKYYPKALSVLELQGITS